MARLSIAADRLVMELQGLHKLWALKSRIDVPLAHVRGATVDPGIVREPKGLRAPGLHVPGAAVIGTFRRDGEKHFWDVTGRAHPVVVQLVDEDYDRLIVEVADPHAVVDQVNRAVLRAGS